MRVVAVIQARMGSTRLPGKVMAPLGGEPMLGRVVVTCYVWRRPDRFRLAGAEESPSRADPRWTVDTLEDRAFAARAYDEPAPRTDVDDEDVLALLAREPELSAINAGVPHKAVPG